MKPGDCINIPAGVKHWHDAAPDSWFSHLAVEVAGEETSNEWCEPVSDEEYGKLFTAVRGLSPYKTVRSYPGRRGYRCSSRRKC